MRTTLPRSPWLRVVFVLVCAVAVASAIWWRGPSWTAVSDAFTVVRWRWVWAAVLLNLLSVVSRSVAWHTAIKQAMPPPHPRFRLVFSAFSVGLFANVYSIYTGPIPNANPQIGDITFIVGFLVTGALYYVFSLMSRSQAAAARSATGSRA